MALLISNKERADLLRSEIQQLSAVNRQIIAIGKFEKELIEQGQSASTVETSVQALLDGVADQLTVYGAAIGGTPTTHQPQVRIGMPALYTSAAIDASKAIGSDFCGTIRVPSDVEGTINPFSVFAADDVVSVSKAEDAGNNGSYTVLYTPNTASTTSLLANGNMTGNYTGWTESSGDINYSANAAVFTNAVSATFKQQKADMTTPWTDGKPYLVTFTITQSAGSITVGTNTTSLQGSASASDTYEAIVLADAHADGLVFTALGFTGTLDSISMVPWTGLAFTTTLAADNAADSEIVITLQER